nr:hypothetical protein [Hoeflea sp. BAL378]
MEQAALRIMEAIGVQVLVIDDEVEQLGCLNNAEPLITDLLNDFEAMQFFLRRSDQTGHDDPDRSWSRPG